MSKCYRCKTLYESATVPDVTIKQYLHGYGEERKKLCPLCQAELEKWLFNVHTEISTDSLTVDEAVSIIDPIFNNPVMARKNGKSGRDLTFYLAWLKIREVLRK